jgi:hypothetical protein
MIAQGVFSVSKVAHGGTCTGKKLKKKNDFIISKFIKRKKK